MLRSRLFRTGAATVTAAWALAPSAGEAAGFYITDVGARGVARGGAFVAAPEGPLAIHYNPAGLSLTRGLSFEVSVSVVDFAGSFDRKCPCASQELGAAAAAAEDARLEAIFAENRADTRNPTVIPFLGLSYGFEPLNLAVGFAVYGPNSGRADYGLLGSAQARGFPERAERKVTRYNALEAPAVDINYALAVAAEPLDGLRLGFTFYVTQVGVGQTLHLFADTAFARGPEDTEWDVPITLDFFSDPILNWAVGISWAPEFVPGLSLGASFRAEREINARGTIDVDVPEVLDGTATVTGEVVDVSLNIAPIARFGVQYEVPDLFAAEVAFVWEGWSVNDRITLLPQEIAFEIPDLNVLVELGEIVSERNWRDSWSIRVGGDIELPLTWLDMQVGYFYEPSAIPPEWLDPSRIDLEKHGFALGVSGEWLDLLPVLSGLSFDLSAMYVAMNGVEVTDSRARNIAPIGFAPELRTVVGNGIYSGSYLIFSASLVAAFDFSAKP
ncbi:MAG: outer membrane protein transport protein [Myxococcota bacterium]